MEADRERLRAAMLRSRGQRAVPPSGAPSDPIPSTEASTTDLRTMLQRRLEERRAAVPRVELPPGEVATNAMGSYWRRMLRYPLEHVHGRSPLSLALRLDGERLGALAKDARFASLQATECLFFDTETTGLSGGSDVVADNLGRARRSTRHHRLRRDSSPSAYSQRGTRDLRAV